MRRRTVQRVKVFRISDRVSASGSRVPPRRAGSAHVRATHQLQRRFDLPPSLGLFALALLFQGGGLLRGLDNGPVAVGVEQLPCVVVDIYFLHSHGVMLLFSARSHRAGEWYTLTLETFSGSLICIWQVARARVLSPFLSKSFFEIRDHFYVCRKQELIHRYHLHETVAAVDENAGVSREGRGIAGDGDHRRHGGCRKLARLPLGTLPRRIEYHRIEPFEFGLPQRATKHVAQLDRDRLEAGCSRRSASQGCDRVLVVVDRGDFRA